VNNRGGRKSDRAAIAVKDDQRQVQAAIRLPLPSELTATMDTIFLTGLTAECIIGIWDWERKIKQKVVIDLEMGTDIRKAAASDHIDDTLDYKKVSKRLLQFVSESEFQLVETLIDRIAQIILTEFNVPVVKVRLNKQGALRGSRDVGIVIERRREDYAAS
jgi:dihydroneopterin aldolase